MLAIGSLTVFVAPWLCRLPGVLGLYFDNLGHFRLLGLLLAASAALLGIRLTLWRRIGAILVVLHAAPILAYSCGGSIAATAPLGQPITLYYANIEMPAARGGRRSDILLKDIRARNPDIVVFTEFDTPGFTFFDTPLAAYSYRSYQIRDDCFGIALYSRRPLRDTWVGPFDGWNLPAIFASLDSPLVEIIVVHPLPPKTLDQRLNRDVVFSNLQGKCRSRDVPRIIVGDLNSTERNAGFQELLKTGMRDTREGWGWSPSWPVVKFEARGWWNWILVPIAIPIDHILVSRHLHVMERATGAPFGSDHLPLFISLALTDTLAS